MAPSMANLTMMLPPMFGLDKTGEEIPIVDRYRHRFCRPQSLFAPDDDIDALLDIFNPCRCCKLPISRCINAPLPAQTTSFSLGAPFLSATTSLGTLQNGKSNADRNSQGDKMESSTEAGALTVSAAATTLPNNRYLPNAFADGIAQPDAPQGGEVGEDQEQLQLNVPQTPHNGGQTFQSGVLDVRPDTPNTERVANILANGHFHLQGGNEIAHAGTSDSTEIKPNMPLLDGLPPAFSPVTPGHQAESWSMNGEETIDSQNAQGFAKLMFPDGDYIVTTHDVEVGRNLDVAARYRRYEKEKKREQQREQRRERVHPARREFAKRELESYQQEPSQPSIPGDDPQHADASESSQSLEGRPAPQSTFSETGGALAFAPESDDEAEGRRGRKKRRSVQYSKSSTSTTSVVPANLHPPAMQAEYSHQELFTEDGEPYSRTLATLPIHTQRPEDITKLSKKHLLFSFNFQEECWELLITGNGAFVNEEFIERGRTVPLSHNDEIQIATVTITFKLPDSHRNSPGLSRGTFSQVGFEDQEDLSEDEARAIGTSPVRRLSNALEDAASSDDDQPLKKSAKLKLKGLKKPQKGKKGNGKDKVEAEEKPAPKISIKKQQRRKSDEMPAPDAEEKAEKGKNPKEAAKHPPEPQVAESIEGPPAAPVFTAEPGSALASVPVDELPQKRKGPGRPPKNGLVSKRDQALVKKKERDFEKAGVAPPPFNKLLEMVRHETKQKEMLAKMQSGALPPGTEMPAPVETDLAAVAAKTPSVPAQGDGAEPPGSLPPDSMHRPSSPRPKRVVRTPSPMKPESAYTEDELKKPSATYVHILDEILRDHPAGQADLQEIYDRIQKRYPHYKYRATTTGWQSSVRHNLLSAPRFKETGKSGKGKLWTINHEVPLEREKKKKTTPPPRTMPMMNGQYMGYGQQPYNGAYGPPTNGQRPANGAPGAPGYYSPYGQGHPNQHTSGHQVQNRQSTSAAAQGQRNGSQAQQQADPFGGLVPEILALRNAFLVPYTNEPSMQAKSEWIGKCIMVFSNRFHGSGEQPDLTVETPEEKKAYSDLDAIFKRYEAMKVKQQQEQQSASSGVPVQANPSNAAPTNPAPEGGTAIPAAPQQQQTVQTAVADGVAYQNANGGFSPKAPQASAAQGQVASGAPMQTSTGPAGGPVGNNVPAVDQSLPTSSTSQASNAAYAAAPSAEQPGQNGVPATSASLGSQPQPMQPVTGSPAIAQPQHEAATQDSVPVSAGMKASTPVQAPPAMSPSERTNLKRAAEDDEVEENDAKRTKTNA